MNFTVNMQEKSQTQQYTALIKEINTKFTDLLLTLHVFWKVYKATMLESKYLSVHHINSQVWLAKRFNLKHNYKYT
jgi:hypothetical protein